MSKEKLSRYYCTQYFKTRKQEWLKMLPSDVELLFFLLDEVSWVN